MLDRVSSGKLMIKSIGVKTASTPSHTLNVWVVRFACIVKLEIGSTGGHFWSAEMDKQFSFLLLTAGLLFHLCHDKSTRMKFFVVTQIVSCTSNLPIDCLPRLLQLSAKAVPVCHFHSLPFYFTLSLRSWILVFDKFQDNFDKNIQPLYKSWSWGHNGQILWYCCLPNF